MGSLKSRVAPVKPPQNHAISLSRPFVHQQVNRSSMHAQDLPRNRHAGLELVASQSKGGGLIRDQRDYKLSVGPQP